MQKPNGYDETQISGDYTPIELGGHHLVIKGVREQMSQSGKNMIVVAFDFAKNDKQPAYFADQFEKDIRPDKKWPFAGTNYILTMDAKDPNKTNRSFKSFITSVERSNQGFICEWGDNFCEQFKGKRVGGVYGIVEDEYNGEIKQRHRLRWFCEDSKVDSAAIPNPKLLGGSGSGSSTSSSIANIPDSITDEEVPF